MLCLQDISCHSVRRSRAEFTSHATPILMAYSATIGAAKTLKTIIVFQKMKCSGANRKTSLLQNHIQNAASISMCRSAVTQNSTDALSGERCTCPFPSILCAV